LSTHKGITSTEEGLLRDVRSEFTWRDETQQKDLKEEGEVKGKGTTGSTTFSNLAAIFEAITRSLSLKKFKNMSAVKLLAAIKTSDTCSTFLMVFHLFFAETSESFRMFL